MEFSGLKSSINNMLYACSLSLLLKIEKKKSEDLLLTFLDAGKIALTKDWKIFNLL